MVKHIVIWNLSQELGEEEKKKAAIKIKTDLESLQGKIPGLLSVEVVTAPYDSSTHDIALFTSYETVEALQSYQVHPEHLKVVEFVRSVTCNRVCFDY